MENLGGGCRWLEVGGGVGGQSVTFNQSNQSLSTIAVLTPRPRRREQPNCVLFYEKRPTCVSCVALSGYFFVKCWENCRSHIRILSLHFTNQPKGLQNHLLLTSSFSSSDSSAVLVLFFLSIQYHVAATQRTCNATQRTPRQSDLLSCLKTQSRDIIHTCRHTCRHTYIDILAYRHTHVLKDCQCKLKLIYNIHV